MKAVFDTKPMSGYDDDVTRRYHYPSRYLAIVDAALDDWVVLRRPRADGGNLVYFAVAKVQRIDAVPASPGRFYARLADYLPFDGPVPWTIKGQYAKRERSDQVAIGAYPTRSPLALTIRDEAYAGILFRFYSEPRSASAYPLRPGWPPPGRDGEPRPAFKPAGICMTLATNAAGG